MATRRRLSVPLLFLALPSVIVVLSIIVLMAVRITTKVRVTLHAKAVWFEVADIESEWERLTNPASVRSLGIERFGEMTFEPDLMEVADWDGYDFETGRFADDAWLPLSVEDRRVALTSTRPGIAATATIEAGADVKESSVQVDPLRVIGGTSVSVEVEGDRNHAATIKLGRLGREPLYVKVFEPVSLWTDHLRLAVVANRPGSQEESSVYRLRLKETDPKIMVTSESGDLVLNLRFARETTRRISFADNVPLQEIRFSTVVEGKPQTTLVAGSKGQIKYLDYPDIDEVPFEAPDFIVLRPSEEDGFWIRKLTWDRDSAGMLTELEGWVDDLRSGARQPLPNHLLTAFQALRHSPRLMILFSIVLWVFPTSLGAYRLYKEITA